MYRNRTISKRTSAQRGSICLPCHILIWEQLWSLSSDDTYAQKSSTVSNFEMRRRLACHVLLLSFLKNHRDHLSKTNRARQTCQRKINFTSSWFRKQGELEYSLWEKLFCKPTHNESNFANGQGKAFPLSAVGGKMNKIIRRTLWFKFGCVGGLVYW